MQLALVSLVVRNASPERAAIVCKFLSDFGETFTESEAFVFLADFTQFLFKVRRREDIEAATTRFDTVQTLGRLAPASERVQQAVERILRHLHAISRLMALIL